VKTKGIHNILNKIIAENFPDHKKEMSTRYRTPPRTPNRHDHNRTPQHAIVKTISTENKERVFKAVREKNQIIYKGNP
jgi:hypothetical protein